MALAAYRHLLRSTRVAFLDDTYRLSASRAQARTAFQQFRNLEYGSPQALEAIKHAEEVARFIRHNLVQGEGGPSKEGKDSETLRLRIHDDIERGDNDTVKMPNGQKVVVQPGCS